MRIALVGFANLLSGLLLIAPWLQEKGIGKKFITQARAKLDPYRNTIGMVDLGLGAVSLINRIGIVRISFMPGGYPQSLVVLGVGLTIGYKALKIFPPLFNLGKKLEPYQPYVGAVGILFGLHAIF